LYVFDGSKLMHAHTLQKSELMDGQEEYTCGGFWLKYG